MKKLLLMTILALPIVGLAQKKGKTGPKVFDLLIGTYTSDDPNASKGIYVYRFYQERGEAAYLNEIETDNPSYLAISPDEKFVYAVNENSGSKISGVSAFRFDKTTGKLELINFQPTVGSPAYISIDKEQKNVFVANYAGGNMMVFPVNKDGSLGKSTQIIEDKGKGPDPDRQEAPHVHSTVISPDQKYVIAADLGIDKINIFRYHEGKNPPLAPATIPFVNTAPGSGPRHSEFTPNGKFMYNLQEMSATITAYSYHDGELKELQMLKMMPDNFKGTNGAADIHVSPDGKFLYATNRGTANELVVYAIDQQSGKLTYVERYTTYGENPRNFIIDPTGAFILVGTKHQVNIFKVNKDSGRLVMIGRNIPISSPVCLKMVAVE